MNVHKLNHRVVGVAVTAGAILGIVACGGGGGGSSSDRGADGGGDRKTATSAQKIDTGGRAAGFLTGSMSREDSIGIAWVHPEDTGLLHTTIWVNIRSGTSGQWSPPIEVAPNTNRYYSNQNLSIDGSDNVVVAWDALVDGVWGNVVVSGVPQTPTFLGAVQGAGHPKPVGDIPGGRLGTVLFRDANECMATRSYRLGTGWSDLAVIDPEISPCTRWPRWQGVSLQDGRKLATWVGYTEFDELQGRWRSNRGGIGYSVWTPGQGWSDVGIVVSGLEPLNFDVRPLDSPDTLSVAEDGTAWLYWTARGGRDNTMAFMAASFNGSQWAPPIEVAAWSTESTDGLTASLGAAMPGGNGVFFYIFGTGDDAQVRGRVFDAAQGILRPSTVIDSFPMSSLAPLDVVRGLRASNLRGDVAFAVPGDPGGGGWRIYRYNGSRDEWWFDDLTSDIGVGEPALFINRAGKLTAVWTDLREGGLWTKDFE